MKAKTGQLSQGHLRAKRQLVAIAKHRAELKENARRQAETRAARKKKHRCYVCGRRVAIVKGKPANMCQRDLDKDRQRKAASRPYVLHWFDAWETIRRPRTDPRVRLAELGIGETGNALVLPLAIRTDGTMLRLKMVRR